MKEVWCNEFASPVLRTFPGSKAIFLIRDPRAIAASFNSTGKRYPCLFYAKQWRKLVTFANLFSQDARYKDKVLIIRYEDVVGDPSVTAKSICDFLGIAFSDDMVNGSKFRDGRGGQWTQNSSYGTSPEITKKFTEKWKEVLTPQEIKLIEKICFYEMKLLNYAPIFKETDRVTLEDVVRPPLLKEEDLAEWIKPFVKLGLIDNATDLLKEYFRSELIRLDPLEMEKIDKGIIESLFVDRGNFMNIRKIAQQEALSISR
jgi:hypothetical protein